MDYECTQLLEEIQALEFRAVELNLFLDTHPDNREALQDYNETHAQLHSLKEQYTSRYGPLIHFGHCPSDYPWQWINEPWPWEVNY